MKYKICASLYELKPTSLKPGNTMNLFHLTLNLAYASIQIPIFSRFKSCSRVETAYINLV